MASRISVLLAEDEPGLRDALADTLRVAGYAVTLSVDGPSAIAQLRSCAFNVLVTDIVMPGRNGLEVATLARQHTPEIKIVFMSGFTEKANVDMVLAMPESIFLQKPFKSTDLLRSIEKLLGKSTA